MNNNFAFIDSQNLNLGILRLGWKLDFRRFRKYLKDKYKVVKAYLFIGYIPENQDLYKSLQEYGYVLIFKPVLTTPKGKIKGNCDAELVLQAMIDINQYEKAIVVTSDGDFHCLVDYLYRKDKLDRILSPSRDHCSILLRKAGKEKIVYMDNLKNKLQYKKEKAPPVDKTKGSASSS
jgi:uncharacterized LabA/DUF88 family protein